MFIIGGLVALGVVALIAALFVIRRPSAGRKKRERSGSRETTSMHTGNAPSAVSASAAVADTEDLLTEVITLHQQAYGIEQRLQRLSEVIERTQPTLLAVKSVHPRLPRNNEREQQG